METISSTVDINSDFVEPTHASMGSQYGTVQAASQYYQECCKVLAYLKFIQNAVEPCVFYKYVNEQMVLFILWVDDCCKILEAYGIAKTLEN